MENVQLAFGLPGQTELWIFLFIVLIIFGPKNLPRLAQSLGRSVRELKNGLAGVSDDLKETMQDEPAPRSTQASEPPTSPNADDSAGETEAEPVQRAETGDSAKT